MSIGTIVTIALLMVVLVMGMYLVRTIMCAGITLTNDISESVKDEVRGLFGVNDFGVKCMGEGGKISKWGDGRSIPLVCIIKEDTNRDYKLTVKSIESLSGVPTNTVKEWITDENWRGKVDVGETPASVLELNIPRDVSATSLKIEIEEDNGISQKTHFSRIDIKHVGFIASAIC